MSEMELFLSLVRKKMMMEDLENSINNNCSHTPLSPTTSADTHNARTPTSVQQLHLTGSPLRPQSLRHQPSSPPTASDVTTPSSSSSFYRSFSSIDADVTSPVSFGSCFSRQMSACSAASADAESTGGGRYKTELCRPFEENGTCRYGDKCQFAHGRAELRVVQRHPKYKTEMCKTFHTTGLCPYGPRCHFIHNEDERRGGGGDTPTSSSNTSSCWDVYRDDREHIKSLPSTGVDRRRLLQRMTSLQPHPSQYDAVSSNPCMTSRLLQRQMSYVEPRCQSLPESITPAQLIAGYSCLLPSASSPSSNYPHQSLVNTQQVICPPRGTLGSSADSPSPASSATDSPPPLSPPVNDQLAVTSLTDEDAFLLKRQLLNASLQSNDELYGDILALGLLLTKFNRLQS